MIILDGGMSRELERVGAPFRQPEWSALALIETPDLVEQVHKEFAEAGADIITTNSYALVPFHIGEERFRTRGRALAQQAGAAARSAANAVNLAEARSRVRVAGSLPPVFGSYLPDLFDPSRAKAYLSELVAGLGSSVDLWLAETLSSLDEAKAVTEVLKGDNRPVWVSFTLEDRAGSKPATLRSGESVLDAASWAAAENVDALLFNCSAPEVMEAAVAAAADTLNKNGSHIPIGVYANAFKSHDSLGANESIAEIRRDLDASAYAEWSARWSDAGASIIGGCCGIGTQHIRALREQLE